MTCLSEQSWPKKSYFFGANGNKAELISNIFGAIFEVNYAERKDTINEQSGKGKVTF